MSHSASFCATGSEIVSRTCVASVALCVSRSSITRASESLSACEVDEVAAIANGALGGLATGTRFGACSGATDGGFGADRAVAAPVDGRAGGGDIVLRV